MVASFFARLGGKRSVHSLALVAMMAALCLSGCADQQQVDVQKKEDKAAAMAAAKDTATIDDARCRSFGFQPGTPRYDQCRKDFDNERKQAGEGQ